MTATSLLEARACTWLVTAAPRPRSGSAVERRSAIESRMSLIVRLSSLRTVASACAASGCDAARFERGVDDEPERRQVLGDAVVHLARQPLALADLGHVPQRRERHRRVQVRHVAVARGLHLLLLGRG